MARHNGNKNSGYSKRSQKSKHRRQKVTYGNHQSGITYSNIVCPSGKRGFVSEMEATMKLRDIQMRPSQPNRPTPVRAYYHEDCGGWHLTSRAEVPTHVNHYH